VRIGMLTSELSALQFAEELFVRGIVALLKPALQIGRLSQR